MEQQDQFLVEEYKNANALTFHIDRIRNQQVSFFLTFLGIIIGGVVTYYKGDFKTSLHFDPDIFIGGLLCLGWLLGLVLVGNLGRLRRVQIEQFGIINNIREHFYKQQYYYWNIIQLSEKTLPQPNRKSGTYLWISSLMMLNSLLLPLAVYFLVLPPLYLYIRVPIVLMIYTSTYFLTDKIYFWYAKPPIERKYSVTNQPFEQE